MEAAGGDAPAAAEPSSTRSNLRFFLFLALFAWILRSLIVAPFSIPSASMLPALYIGDYLVVAKWPYGYSRVSFPLGVPSFEGRVLGKLPKRGDVVVFRHPTGDSDVVKRVIGLPEDIVEVRGGRVLLNNRPLATRPLPPAGVATSPNSPCKTMPPSTTIVEDGQCRYNAALETLPGGANYTILNQVEGGPAVGSPGTELEFAL